MVEQIADGPPVTVGGCVELLGGGGQPQFLADCTPGYYNNEGKPDDRRGGMFSGYPGGPVAFFTYIDAWRSSGAFEGLDLRREPVAV